MVGSADCDGAILLQGEQLVRVAWMSCVIPGQKLRLSKSYLLCLDGQRGEQIGMQVSRRVG